MEAADGYLAGRVALISCFLVPRERLCIVHGHAQAVKVKVPEVLFPERVSPIGPLAVPRQSFGVVLLDPDTLLVHGAEFGFGARVARFGILLEGTVHIQRLFGRGLGWGLRL